VGLPHLSWRRLASFIRYLPRDSATKQEANGPAALWSDSEHLMAMVVDAVTMLDYHFLKAWMKDPPKKPPEPVKRPVELRRSDAQTLPQGTVVNLQKKEQIKGGSMDIDELNRLIEQQTGAPMGIATN
jgi:hypothetical protein